MKRCKDPTCMAPEGREEFRPAKFENGKSYPRSICRDCENRKRREARAMSGGESRPTAPDPACTPTAGARPTPPAAEPVSRANELRRPRSLLLDIETAPLQSMHWGIWQENIGLEQIKDEWSIISFAAKWLDMKSIIQHDVGNQKDLRDDKSLLAQLWALLDDADIVIAQNGKRFDVPKINSRLLMAGFRPYSPIKVVDTLLIAKKHFAFTSNKLAWLSRHLSQAKKLEHREFPGFELWKECLAGNHRAWEVMREYNIQDVKSLEEVYLVMRPWAEGHPNVGAYAESDIMSCPKCGAIDLEECGKAYTQTGEYNRLRCRKCGGYARSRYTTNSPAKRRSLLSN